MSFLERYFRSRRRRPTSNSSPRRLWWSCLCTLRCSVRSEIRRVSNATWTSGEPVSPSLVACPAMISFFTVVSSGTLIPLHVESRRRSPADHADLPGQESAVRWARGSPSGQPHEGAANLARSLADLQGTTRRRARGCRRAARRGHVRTPRSCQGAAAGVGDVAAHLDDEITDGGEPGHAAEPHGEV